MSTPSAAFILVCPTCGKKYQGNPDKPNARYKCPKDQVELVRPEVPAPAPVPPLEPKNEISLDYEATQRMAPPPSYESTQKIDIPSYEQTQRIETQSYEQTQRIETQGYEQTQKIDIPVQGYDAPPPRTTQPIDQEDIPTQRITQQIATPETDNQEEQATRVISSDASPYNAAEDQATRVMGSGEGAGRTPTPTPTPRTTQAYSAGATVTIQPEERKSVIAMIQGSASSGAAASLLSGKYEEVSKLGQGGVGEVVKVMDRDLKREVAMKRLLSQGSGDDSLIRFVEEAQATGQLEHPNIVPVHDLGVDADGRVYFTLKLVQGASLKKVIQGRNDNAILDESAGAGFYRQRYTPLRMIEILIAMCQAVAYAHSKGIIHRDLKPDNVMLGKYGEVLVMDWGLAKLIANKLKSKSKDSERETVRVMTSRSEDDSQSTMEGSIAGTPAYMSPEQAAGKISELDQRTDIYALGAILYEILTGQPPYKGAGALALVKQVVEGPPPPLKDAKGAFAFQPIPRELRAICEKAMGRKPQDRYASASLLRDDLQAYIENQPVSAAPDTPVQRAIKWVKRNKRQVQTSGLSAAAVLVVIFGGWFAWNWYTIYSLNKEANNKLNAARDQYKSAAVWKPSATNNDAYAALMANSAAAEAARTFRAGINAATEPLRRALDMDPKNPRARLLLAESYMEQWRLALAENNVELAKATRADVERYAPSPSPFAAELNGFGSLNISFDPPDAEAYLFRYETLRSKDAKGSDLPARLIPVPYDFRAKKSDASFLDAERSRIARGGPLPPEKHSIFNLQPSTASFLGGGTVNVPELAPGSYMLLVRANGRAEIRVPFFMPRNGKIQRTIDVPRTEDMPPGFFYMAGGPVWVGGTTAGAPAPHVRTLPPSFIYHDEITMGEYAAFLKDLTRTGRAAEARQHLPKDFGRNLAVLNSAGELIPATGGADPVEFAKSPVRGVSFNDAQAYIAWRSQQDGLPYRLPKDWEWEGACRGADGRTYSWGNEPGKGLAVVTQGYGDSGNNMSWKWEDYKDESPWGPHNMAGGAAEWTMAKFDPNAKPEDPVFGQYAIRGNAWALPPTGLECAFRTSGQPDYFHPTIGFRMALDYPMKRIGPAKEGAMAGMDHAH